MSNRCPTDVKYEFHGMDMDIYKDLIPSEEYKMTEYEKGVLHGIMVERRSVEPKHGRWIRDAENFGKYYCSKCGFSYIPIDVPKNNYCPNCGADMREVEE